MGHIQRWRREVSWLVINLPKKFTAAFIVVFLSFFVWHAKWSKDCNQKGVLTNKRHPFYCCNFLTEFSFNICFLSDIANSKVNNLFFMSNISSHKAAAGPRQIGRGSSLLWTWQNYETLTYILLCKVLLTSTLLKNWLASVCRAA